MKFQGQAAKNPPFGVHSQKIGCGSQAENGGFLALCDLGALGSKSWPIIRLTSRKWTRNTNWLNRKRLGQININ